MKTYQKQVFKRGDKFYVWKQWWKEVELPTPEVVIGLEPDTYSINMDGLDDYTLTVTVNPSDAWNTKVKAKSLHPGVFVENLGYQGEGETDFKITVDNSILLDQKGFIEFSTEAGGYTTYVWVENIR